MADIKINLARRPDITQVKAIFDDGSETMLPQRPIGNTGEASPCTFFDVLTDGSFDITLRLDWSKMDSNGDPILDADIKHRGKKYRVCEKKWHHTRKAFESGEWVYIFEFENIKLRFKVGTTNQRHQQGQARIAPPAAPSADGVFTEDPHVPWAFGKRQVFCAASVCQVVTTQDVVVDHNHEIVVTCHCGRHLKFPLTETEEQLNALLAAHHKANRGQRRV
ncbi:MAG: hypothetical protein A3J28_10680 [Acidobacteria bacterium RIFCSPLOWO2_12_FULL_60_22]|nr:MAG: hypothetical protein A3J28_10680 [Acidobacteria bacterium RIFCSPLOWO2_12_FULL_60_22]